VIMLSANIGDASPAGHPGHDDTLAKPFDIRQLHDKIAHLLGLEWVHEDALPAPVHQQGKPWRSPGDRHVQELIRLGEIGYIRGIETKLAQIAKLERNRPFTEALGRYVEAFDLAGYERFLRQFEQEKEQTGGE
ncbi:MAG: hybrid sensor histidine kinase/response regulator, partial [Alphaproteobacteria bacterium]